MGITATATVRSIARYGYGGYYGVPNAGQVKLDTKVKDAQVFVDGAYAGTSGKPQDHVDAARHLHHLN